MSSIDPRVAGIRAAFLGGLALALAFAAPGESAAQKRVALVLGNAAYQNAPPLNNPVNDAKAIAGALEQLGFEVQTALDVSQAEALEALDRFAAALPGAEAAFFFYSGHGIQLEGTNFLLPVDVEASSERTVRYGAIDIAEIVRDMESNAEISIVVLDACRDNPFLSQLAQSAPRTRSAAPTRGLAVIKPSGSGTIIAYAAAAGAVASDGESDHSPYTDALLEHMAAPNVEVGLMFRRVAGDVVDATGREQQPEVLIRLTREFYMNPEVAAAPEAPVAATPDAPVEEPDADAPLAPVIVIEQSATETLAAAPDRTADEQLPPVEDETDVVRGESGPYADLRARLDLSQPLYQPLAAWQPPERQSFDADEPNDSFGSAYAVTINADVGFAIAPRGDADWLYFTAGSGGVLNLRTAQQPAAIDISLRVFNADGRDLTGWITTPRTGGVLDDVVDLPSPGVYWIEIRDGSNDAESPERIELALSFTPQEDGYEPNDVLSEARVLAPDGTHRLNILPRGEVDYFQFPISLPGELQVLASNVPEQLDVALRLLDYDKRDLSGWIVPPRPGGDTDARFPVKEPGLYFLEVRDSSNDGRSGTAFTLESSFRPSPDAYEPNDSVGAARRIAPSGEHVATIFPRGDADWYSVDVGHPGELWIEAVDVPESLDISLRVFDPDQRDMTGWIPAPRPGGDTTGFADLPRPGTYAIEVRDGSNDSATVTPFNLVTRFTPAPDQYEPNDSFGYATPIRLNGEIAFNILPRGDSDWFKIAVDQPGELAVSIDEGPDNLDIHFRIFDANQTDMTGWIAPYSQGGLTEGLADLPLPGAYFIEVRDGGSDARSIRHATLSTTFTPTELSYEPNDSFGTASKVSLVGASPAHILPRGDADWHVFYVPEPGTLDITIDDMPEALDVVFRVFNGDQRDLTGWISPPRAGGVTSGSVTLDSPGWYWMEIRDGSNDGRSPTPFRVTRAFTAH